MFGGLGIYRMRVYYSLDILFTKFILIACELNVSSNPAAYNAGVSQG